jgi:hypothetical protein
MEPKKIKVEPIENHSGGIDIAYIVTNPIRVNSLVKLTDEIFE